MTRREFEEEITSWGCLIDFCIEYGCGYCDGIYDQDQYNDAIEEELGEVVGDWSWQDVLNWLYDLPSGDYYYRKDDYGDWRGAEDDFDVYRDDVLEWGDDREVWDEEPEYEEPEDQYAEPEEEVFDEDISMDELFIPQVFEIKRKPEEDNVDIQEEDEGLLEELLAI